MSFLVSHNQGIITIKKRAVLSRRRKGAWGSVSWLATIAPPKSAYFAARNSRFNNYKNELYIIISALAAAFGRFLFDKLLFVILTRTVDKILPRM